MIDDFIEKISDDSDIEHVKYVGYSSDPDPTGPITRGQVSSEIAQAMQYAIYSDQDLEQQIEALESENAELKKRVDALADAIKALTA